VAETVRRTLPAEKQAGWGVIGMLAAAQFIMVLDTTVMNVSINKVVVDLNTTVVGLQTAITLYTLVMAAFMLIGGKIGDKWGAKRAFLGRPDRVRRRLDDHSLLPEPDTASDRLVDHRRPRRHPRGAGHRGAHGRHLQRQAARGLLRHPRRRRRCVDGRRPDHRRLGHHVCALQLAHRLLRGDGHGAVRDALPEAHPGHRRQAEQAGHGRRGPVRRRSWAGSCSACSSPASGVG